MGGSAGGVNAPGRPGIAPTWSSSAKDAVTTSLGPAHLWATLGFGIVNEVFYPSTGEPQVRDFGFIVAKEGAWFEVKRVNRYALTTPEPYIPLPTVRHAGPGYSLELTILPDPLRETLLVRYKLTGEGFQLYPLLAPHLGPKSGDNTAWVEEGLCAVGGSEYLYLASDSGFSRASAGFVGVSDGWSDFSRHGALTQTFERAEHGNVALIGELTTRAGVLALGFAESYEGAKTRARSSLAEGFEPIRERFVASWQAWGEALKLPETQADLEREALLCATVLKVHEDKSFPGAVVASLSVPWGSSRDDLGGYHLVWARDAVQAGFGLLAAGQVGDARRMLAYLIATQQPDGHWTQNFYPDGTPYWRGLQLDEVGFPVLLAAKLAERGQLGSVHGVGEMARRAAGFLAKQGPVSPQDRWEENAGLSPFTLAVEVAALVAAAEFLADKDRDYALSLADYWNEAVEAWTYAERTELAKEHSVEGYYVRIAPNAQNGGLQGAVTVKNRADTTLKAANLVSLDFLYLARLGLRRADDPRMLNTMKVADALLKVDTPSGVSYHRYNEDGYGEHADGSPFDGTGVGRAWPLLTGERGHYAVQLGDDPTPYLEAMTRMTGPGGLIPEQVWDAEAIPERFLFPGKPSGSAMPLVWAHAEFLKLLYAARQGEPLELLATVERRYGERPTAQTWHWRSETPFEALPRGRDLLVESPRAFVLHVGTDGWQRVSERASAELGLGMHGVRLGAAELAGHARLEFTRYYPESGTWEKRDYVIGLEI